ncbi:DUF397 domain-containing protein [Actinomadura harenae]|uniref:DUF397 domain-containing protein n=1 Tax=Actinomadura harenae TaxID=2483351 RepID=A0A3M2LQ41_9ACTN|nr:DUF397 domain-containing protein [Actinomadura harenae]RMI39614.1 DUF397 domain-containing protein [Actinomadura harenae]
MRAPHEPSVLRWRTSGHSSPEGQCVEVAGLVGGLAVRDSKDPGGPRLVLPAAAWDALSSAIRAR